jgi:hypothetical protein
VAPGYGQPLPEAIKSAPEEAPRAQNAPNNSVNKIEGNGSSQFFPLAMCNVTVDGTLNVTSIMDSGSSRSLLNPRFSDELQRRGIGERLPSTDVQLSGASGKKLKILSRIRIPLTFGSVTFDHEFLVVSELRQAMLLGTDFFFLTNASIDFSSDQVHIKRFGIQIPLVQERIPLSSVLPPTTLYFVGEQISVPSFTQVAVPVGHMWCDPLAHATRLGLAADREINEFRSSLFVEPELIQVTDGHATIKVTNLSPRPVWIGDGQPIAELLPAKLEQEATPDTPQIFSIYDTDHTDEMLYPDFTDWASESDSDDSGPPPLRYASDSDLDSSLSDTPRTPTVTARIETLDDSQFVLQLRGDPIQEADTHFVLHLRGDETESKSRSLDPVRVPVLSQSSYGSPGHSVLLDFSSEPNGKEDCESEPPKEEIASNLAEINVNKELKGQQRIQLNSLLEEFSHLFVSDIRNLTPSYVQPFHIDTGNANPVNVPPRRVPPAHRIEIERQIQDWKDAGLITESNSPWASPIVMVPKAGGAWRIACDYRPLNRRTVPDRYPLTNIEDAFSVLGGNMFFSTIDLKSGFFQVPLTEDSKAKTAFITHKGLHQFNCLPFGVRNAPAHFSRVLDYVLGGMKYTKCVSFIDDLNVFASDWDTHLSNLRELFERLQKFNLQMNPVKCFFGYMSCTTLGT